MTMVLNVGKCCEIERGRADVFSRCDKPRSRVRLAAGILGSLALFPLVALQGILTRCRMPTLPGAQPPHCGLIPGTGRCLRILAIGDSSVSGVGVVRGDETVSASTARALARMTGQPIAWRALGLSGATAKMALHRLVPRLVPQPADLLVIAFGVNDAMAYRSPAAFARDVAALVLAARRHVGDAAVVIAGVAPLRLFPGLPSPLREILGWRCAALQAAAERVSEVLPRVVAERFSMLFVPDLFASDGFHPNARAHGLWGEDIAALALPLLSAGAQPRGVPPAADRRRLGMFDTNGADHRRRSNAHRLPRAAAQSELAS
jgi:lysophospholipase L1-like esterase